MSSDTQAGIGTILGTGLVLGGLLSTQIAGINARIDDVNTSVNARIDDVNASMNARFNDVNARIDDLQDDIRELRALIFETFKPDDLAD